MDNRKIVPPTYEVHNYLHIPKTGGTGLKYALTEFEETDDPSFPRIVMPEKGHTQRLASMGSNVCFIIRHPLERFCSGFWERVNMQARKELAETTYKDQMQFGYKDLSKLEIEILDQCATPNDYISYIRQGGNVVGTNPGLFELTAPLSKWLGNIPTFQSNEHKIKLVYHVKDLNRIMSNVYSIKMPTDPFKMRSRALFNTAQSYKVSGINRDWFENEYRKQDYDLIKYIKTRPYWVDWEQL